MTEKRFEIIKSAIIDGARVIKDNEKKYTFATTFETATLINYRKALNELNDENEQLKQTIETQNFNYENAKGIIHSSEHQIRILEDENKQLRIDKQNLYRQDSKIRIKLHQLMEENDELKNKVKFWRILAQKEME